MSFWNKNKLSFSGITLVVIFIASIAVVVQGRLLGRDADALFAPEKENKALEVLPTKADLEKAGCAHLHLSEMQAGVWEMQGKDSAFAGTVISSSFFSDGVEGYGGPIPLFIFLNTENVIDTILVLENNESAEFIEDIISSPLMSSWQHKSIDEALTLQVDALSGATFSSRAIIQSLKLSLNAYAGRETKVLKPQVNIVKTLAAIVLLILIMFVVFLKQRKPWYRKVILVLNVVVLGFWCGNYISVSFFVNSLASGTSLSAHPIQGLLLLLVLGGAFMGKRNVYCNWVCPFGAAQELAGLVKKNKWKIPLRGLRVLNYCRENVLILLMFLVWMNIAHSIFDYEPFSAFQFLHADKFTIAFAVVFLALSVFVDKPWCRFVCPSGQLLRGLHK